jgi:hypothetical protein
MHKERVRSKYQPFAGGENTSFLRGGGEYGFTAEAIPSVKFPA